MEKPTPEQEQANVDMVKEIIDHLGKREWELINLKARTKKEVTNDTVNKG